ncbi:unnamed protein product, partial [Prorocentrum cordatum]
MAAGRSERPRSPRCRCWRLGALFLGGLAALKQGVGFASPRTSRPRGEGLARVAGRAMVKDPLQGVSPEVERANSMWARRLEDIFLSGSRLWAAMQKQGNTKKFYFIGTNGNMGDQ